MLFFMEERVFGTEFLEREIYSAFNTKPKKSFFRHDEQKKIFQPITSNAFIQNFPTFRVSKASVNELMLAAAAQSAHHQNKVFFRRYLFT